MIELIGVSRTVASGGAPLTILHPTTLRIDDGRVAAVTGPSGSGKSTLLGLIAGLDSPTTGRILLDGVDITALGEEALARLRRGKIGIVFQFFHLIPTLTALENVLVPMEIADAWRAGARPRPHCRRRIVRPAASLPIPTLRRGTAAGRHRRAPWRTIRRSCWPMSRPAIWTARPAARSSTCSFPSTGSAAAR